MGKTWQADRLLRMYDVVAKAEDDWQQAHDHRAYVRQEFGRVFRAARLAREESLRACARRYGVSAPFLCDIELGRRWSESVAATAWLEARDD